MQPFDRLPIKEVSATLPVPYNILDDHKWYVQCAGGDHEEGKRYEDGRYTCTLCRTDMFTRILRDAFYSRRG